MTKKIVDNIPIITSIIIIIGIIKLTLYYENFSLPIRYFISFSEITTAVSEDLLMLLLFYLITKISIQSLSEVKPKFITFPSFDKLSLIYSLFLVLASIGLLIWNMIDKPYYLKIINTSLMFFSLFLTFLSTKAGKEFLHKNSEIGLILTYFIFTTLNVVFATSNEIRSVTNGKYTGTKVVTNDSVYISNDTNYYIGKTENYLFFYNSKKKCTVIPNASIKLIDIVVNDK